MNNENGRLKVFIIDDDLAIRQCLKILLTSLYGDKFDIYSSGDGVEGLGMLYILNPDLIIIDTTLPTYSGRELIDYVTSNGRFTNTKLIVVDDRGNLVPGLNPNIKILSKQNTSFVKELETTVRETLGPGETTKGILGNIKNFFIRKTLSWANRSDLVMFNISKNRGRGLISFLKSFLLFPFWVISQIFTSLGLAFLYLFTSGKIKDANIPQAVSDNKAFRVLAYPTLIGVLTAAVFFIIQIALFIGGGIVIFNSIRLESIFANNGGEVSLNFNTATYDSNLIELVEGRLRLKEQFTSVEVEDAPAEFTEEPTPDETVLNQPDPETPTEETPEVIEPAEPVLEESEPEGVQPVENTGRENNGEVQGIVDAADVVGVSAETVSVGYSVANPSITFNESIEFSNLVRIEESSTVTNLAESTPDINSLDSKRSGVSIEDLKTRVFPTNTITYQLSPNNLDWYYFNANNVVDADNLKDGWEKTEQGFVSSNTVQEVNQYLSNYLEAVGGNTLYLRVYLHSDGASQVSLNEIKVIREQSIVTLLNEEVPEDLETEEEVASLPITFPIEVEDENENTETVIPELPIPTIFQATYVNGNKVVYGKLLGASIPDSELQYIKVNVYYTSSTDIAKTAEDKLELIGESSLSRNEAGDLTFLLQTPNREGGYVTAELVYVINNVEVTSILSKPLENSTFTVDSTADTADHTLNGICSAGTATGGACTLRAAIAEANSVAGADNIYFNIPTSDAGYRDYDAPDSPSSGDGVGGDDYWTIRPGVTAIPQINETIHIDGSTQTTNQGNTNALGPEIEINGMNQGHKGLVIDGAGSAGSSINSLAIIRFANHVVQVSSTDTFTLNGSYVGGMDIQAKTVAYQTSYGLYILSTTGLINIGNETGNIFGATGGLQSVNIECAAGGNVLNVKKNKFGIGSNNESLAIFNTGLLIRGNCDATVGGDDVADRNYFFNFANYAVMLYPTHTNHNVYVKNNYFGTDTSGNSMTSAMANSTGIQIEFETVTGFTNSIIIESNLFRDFGSYGVRNRGSSIPVIIRENSFGTNKVAAAFIRNLNSSTNPNPTWFQNTLIINNFMGETESDPYFSKSFIENNVRYGIWMNGSAATVKGNIINNDGSSALANIYADHNSNPIIGGTADLAGSLCEGKEKNCIEGAVWNEIYMVDSVPKNEATLFTDNTFPNVKDDANAIEQTWYGLFEVFSGDKRRTDLANGTVSIPIPDDMLIKTNSSSEVILNKLTTLTNYNVTCTVALNCPLSDGTTGVTSVLGNSGSFFSNEFSWLRVTEYVIDKNGVKTEYSTSTNPTKFDEPHLVSREFSFDGNSTTHIPSSDRGQPWTTNLSGDRNISTGNFGRFQIMEVEYVDANPILQEDGSYIITVDSTEESTITTGTTYYDDGTGAGSGGMSKLATAGLANGKTSLREAVNVANTRSGFDNIFFNIPETDTNYIPPSGSVQGYFSISSTDQFLFTDDAGTFLNGYSQPGSSRNTAKFGETVNAVLKIQIKRTSGIGVLLGYTSNNNHIAGINGNQPLAANAIAVWLSTSDNNWVEGNIFGGNIDGTPLPGNQGALSILSNSNNNIIGTNGDGNNDEGERNIFMGDGSWNNGKIDVELGSNNVVAGNYVGVDKTSRTCATGTTNRQQIIVQSNSVNALIGSNLDGISDSEEANIAGCVTANQRGQINVLGSSGTKIQGNYVGTNTYGDVLSTYTVSGVNFRDGVSTNNIVKGNIIANNNGAGIRVGLPTGILAALRENKIFGNTYEIDIVTAAGNFNIDNRTVNDSGDIDTGPNNVMNYPEIHRVTYLSGGKYKVEGILDNNVSGEGPFDIETCLSDNHSSGHGGCTQSLGYFENVVTQISGGLNPWSVEVTVAGDNGTQDRIFTSLATNNLGSTSEFSENFNTATNPNFSLAKYPITLTAPLDNETVTDTSPLLNWADNGDLDLKHYEIYLNGSFYALVLANHSDLDIPAALPAGTYTWQVVGVRKDNTESGRSDTRTFIVPGEALVSFPVVEPITPLPPVSFIPREDEIPVDGISSITQDTLLTVTLAVLGIAISAGAIVFIKRRWF